MRPEPSGDVTVATYGFNTDLFGIVELYSTIKQPDDGTRGEAGACRSHSRPPASAHPALCRLCPRTHGAGAHGSSSSPAVVLRCGGWLRAARRAGLGVGCLELRVASGRRHRQARRSRRPLCPRRLHGVQPRRADGDLSGRSRTRPPSRSVTNRCCYSGPNAAHGDPQTGQLGTPGGEHLDRTRPDDQPHRGRLAKRDTAANQSSCWWTQLEAVKKMDAMFMIFTRTFRTHQ